MSMKDIPYNTLKQDARAYEIMLLRDQHAYTYTAIAKAYGLSVARAIQIYIKQKTAQKRFRPLTKLCYIGKPKAVCKTAIVSPGFAGRAGIFPEQNAILRREKSPVTSTKWR